MRIALLTRRFDPAGGGTERDLMVTAESLLAAGHQLRVYAAEVRGLWKRGPVHQLTLPRFSRTLMLTRFAYLAPAVARREGADLVLSFARTVGADVLRSGGGAHAAYLRAARRWRGALQWSAMWCSPYHRAQMRLERRGFRHPALRKVIAVSNLVRDDLTRRFELPPDKPVTIYNGVDLERFAPARDAGPRDEVRSALGLSSSTPVVTFVGNGFGRKGLGPLLEAWPALDSDAHLLVVGNDRHAAGYRRLARRLGIAERVSFLGARERVEDLFRASDAFALPSLFEPFGNVVLEAMACGLPALTSAYSGVAELMPAELRPFVVRDPSNPAEIAERMRGLVASRKELAAVARATAERFTWTRYAQELQQLLDSVVRPAPASDASREARPRQ